MQKKVFIVHGWEGYPEEGWFPWLKKELTKRGFNVEILSMPDPSYPRIETWVPFLSKAVGIPDKNTYFVGHSIGCQTILRYIEKTDRKIGGAVFVGGWLKLSYPPDYKVEEKDLDIDRPWMKTPIDFIKIKNYSSRFVAIFSDDDPWVPAENIDIFKKRLGAKIIIEHAKGHFAGSNNITQLPTALESVLKLSK